jgi:uncharacterized protein
LTLLLLLALLLASLVVYCLFILPTQWLKIERVRHPLNLQLTILQISDLHVEMLRVSPERLLKLIHKETPDLIVLTGDFTRKERYLPRVEQFLTRLKACGIPMYAVLGNHDYKMNDVRMLLRLLARLDIRVLRNESLQMDGFQLVGIDDYGSGHSRLPAAFRKVKPNVPAIILTHDPNVVCELRKPYSYLMSGHLHGKQFNLPFFFAIKRKGALPSKGIYKGLHQGNFGTFYISKGIGQAGLNCRFMVRSEVTLHYL